MGKKITYIDVKNYIEQQRYKLLSNEYINANKKLKLQCPKGHIYETTYGNFHYGCRCLECSGKIKHSIENVKNYIEQQGCKLLSTEYKNINTKLKIKCSKGHIFEIKYNDFQQGHRCSECAGNKKLDYNNVKNYIESFDYKLLSDTYKNKRTKLKIQCSKGHKYNVKWNDFQQGCRCPLCKNINGGSKPEKEIVDFVKTIYTGEIVENDRTIVKNYWTNKNLELDIFLSELKFAIEFNGRYWHNNDKVKWTDEMKKKQCIKKGINLLVINEQDWYNDKVNCLNKIKELIKERN